SRFSFNVEQGRCPECKGQGSIHVEMSFLPDVDVPCETCNGMRFTPETLAVRWQGLNAGQLLALEVAEAVEVFSPVKTIRQPLELLNELGLGYLHLGQPSNTLSGGEAQRIKLVSELAAGLNTGPTCDAGGGLDRGFGAGGRGARGAGGCAGDAGDHCQTEA
ncbi:MAG: hypothetical protein JRF48_11345, partial [Deltaproteobacteria bacterium]|nr:hypothetical protein [Deltaproteobacteria bacterium]